jgi:hypothetical protein
VNLTAAQRQQTKTIFQNTRQQVQALAQQLRQDRQSLKAAAQAGDTAQIQQLSTARVRARSAGMVQFYALLKRPTRRPKSRSSSPKASNRPFAMCGADRRAPVCTALFCR